MSILRLHLRFMREICYLCKSSQMISETGMNASLKTNNSRQNSRNADQNTTWGNFVMLKIPLKNPYLRTEIVVLVVLYCWTVIRLNDHSVSKNYCSCDVSVQVLTDSVHKRATRSAQSLYRPGFSDAHGEACDKFYKICIVMRENAIFLK